MAAGRNVATIDFGAVPIDEASFTISDAAIISGELHAAGSSSTAFIGQNGTAVVPEPVYVGGGYGRLHQPKPIQPTFISAQFCIPGQSSTCIISQAITSADLAISGSCKADFNSELHRVSAVIIPIRKPLPIEVLLLLAA